MPVASGVVQIASTSATGSKAQLVTGLVTTTTRTTTAAVAQKSMLGINLTDVNYWSSERAFANLALGSRWRDAKITGWPDLPAAQTDRVGNLTSFKAGSEAIRVLITPAAALTAAGAKIRCTWTGYAQVRIRGNISSLVVGANYADFVLKTTPTSTVLTSFAVTDWKASDPLRYLDCRETDLAKTATFAPEFLDGLKPFGIIRYMKWSVAEENPALVTWSQRTHVSSIDQNGPDGVALEHMVALSNTTGTDLWLTIPWNADEDYVRRMAQLIHDGVPANRNVYVEMSNEVWNSMYPVAKQASQEGMSVRLATVDLQARLFRYAEKSKWALNIWTQVFADRPKRLVRVVASQDANPWTAEQILSFKDTAKYVDALATAPYFGYDLLKGGEALNAVPGLMSSLSQKMSATLYGPAAENSRIAKKYGKRFIAYEAGQHVSSGTDAVLPTAINRDPSIYQIYKNYMAIWKTQYNDTLMMFATKYNPGKSAFGLQEYPGQPAAQAPKWRAVLDSQASFIGPDKGSN